MNIILFGGSGFIGQELIRDPAFLNDQKVVVSRKPGGRNKQANTSYIGYDKKVLSGFMDSPYAIINLAGASIGSHLWTDKRKKRILESRTSVGHFITELVREAILKPEVIIQASAVGYYGSRGETKLTEQSDMGKGFLPEVVNEWEGSIDTSTLKDTRTVFIRTGIVLSPAAGMLNRLQVPMKLFVGGHVGSGKQWVPWIHWKDEINAIRFLLTTKTARGVYNLSAPNPERMQILMSFLGNQLKRPSWFHIPGFLVHALAGRFGDELLLTSQYVYPEKLLKEGFAFQFENLDSALKDLYHHE